MSRRGGGGRGRGGSKSTLSSSKELLKRSASEAGLDDRHVKVLSDITRPPLFPDFLWKSAGHYWNEEDVPEKGNHDNMHHQQPIKTETSLPSRGVVTGNKLPASMISMINKQRELTKRFQNSSYYIRPGTIVDIVRYSDRADSNKNHTQPQSTAHATVLASLGACTTNTSAKYIPTTDDSKYFPEELLPIKKTNLKLHNDHSSPTRTSKYAMKTDTAVAIKLEKLDYQEETGKIRTTSITSMTSNDDLMLSVPAPATENPRKSSEADETVLGDLEEDDEDDNDILEENVEEELGEDYTTNYYASDDDNNDDDNDDGEPTY